jgi:hypothetical protein
MGGLVFALAVLVAIAVVGARAVARRVRAARLPDTVAVASWADIPGVLRRRDCPCGRIPDELGEHRTDDGVVVTRECVCGRTEKVTFVLAH